MADKPLSATVDAAGAAVIPIQPYGGLPWLVDQVSVELATAPAGSTCALRKYFAGSVVGILISPMVPTGDTAAGDPPVSLLPEDRLQVEWAGCTPGDLARAWVSYQQVRR